ncbi:MAG: GGDEF domain-containing protein [Campylobacterales bacterium]|nr:GGDEF domain-containing protein [Campylobacterales bacterium]
MDKIKAEKVIISAFNSLIGKLHAQEKYDPKTLIDDMYRLAKTLNSDTSLTLSLQMKEESYELEYKALAEESLNSYTQTKESVERITKEQCKLIDDSKKKNMLPVDRIMNSFSTIHAQLESQMQNANETIKALHQQVSILEKTSHLDPLTHALNRRALDSYLGKVCSAPNKSIDTHIMLIDIDNFKLVNDNYGHLAGDRVLVFLAKLISNSLREGDKLFRYGGEEFLIILSRSNTIACTKVAERILQGVRSNTLFYKEHEIKITLSIGTASLEETDTFDSFIDRADKALYKAKANGKDQLVVA